MVILGRRWRVGQEIDRIQIIVLVAGFVMIIVMYNDIVPRTTLARRWRMHLCIVDDTSSLQSIGKKREGEKEK